MVSRRPSASIYERARAEACRLLETHRPQPLSDEVAAELARIVAGAERELRGESM